MLFLLKLISGRVGELFVCANNTNLSHLVDTFLDRVGYSELVNSHGMCLADAVDVIECLVLRSKVERMTTSDTSGLTSMAGFHHGSMTITLLQAVRSSP